MGRKAQKDEEELKTREGGEFSLNSFRSPLQDGDVKSSCNLGCLVCKFFFFCKPLEGGKFSSSSPQNCATRRACIVLQFCETSLFSKTVFIP